jgi:hypothetical protein
VRKNIRTNVQQRIAANRQRMEEAREREERERELLQKLNAAQKKEQQR